MFILWKRFANSAKDSKKSILSPALTTKAFKHPTYSFYKNYQ